MEVWRERDISECFPMNPRISQEIARSDRPTALARHVSVSLIS